MKGTGEEPHHETPIQTRNIEATRREREKKMVTGVIRGGKEGTKTPFH